MSSNRLYNLLLKGWFRIKGRSNRKEYILRFFIMIFMCCFFKYLCYLNITTLITGFLITPLLIITVVQVFFVTHRRLHDLNASGWWQLITFIPFGQLLMIAFIFFKGTEGPNKYGEPPEY